MDDKMINNNNVSTIYGIASMFYVRIIQHIAIPTAMSQVFVSMVINDV